ncbi:MAG: 4Fe-4S binding protein [Acidimicrobiales bacterium]
MITVDTTTTTLAIGSECTACGACVLTCPTHALLPAPGRPSLVESRCILCLECVEICPRGVISELAREL